MTTPHQPSVPIHARRLVTLGSFALAGFAVWYWFNPTSNDPTLTATTIGLFALGIVPTLLWVKRCDESYPVLEIMLLTTIPFYAMPILTEHTTIGQYPVDLLEKASLAVLVFLVAAIGGGVTVKRFYRPGRRRPFWHDEIIPEEKLHFTAHAVTITTVYLFLMAFTQWIPQNWVGTFRAMFMGVGTVSLFLQARFWGAGSLSVGHKTLLCFNLLLQLGILFMSLMLVAGIIFLLVVLLGYFTTARRVPWMPCVVLLPILGVLHVGKAKMREIYWGDHAPQVGLTDVPGFFSRWFIYGLEGAPSEEDSDKMTPSVATYGLMRRASLFQIVCVAVFVTPDRRPYLDGASYNNIAAQLVPRPIWPNKPKPADSVKLLSIQLGLQTTEEAEVTSIGFGMLSEAYANFGFLGEAGLGFILGVALALVAESTATAPTFSLAGILRILCLTWCLNAESPLIVWVSSLYQACAALFAVLLACKAFSR